MPIPDTPAHQSLDPVDLRDVPALSAAGGRLAMTGLVRASRLRRADDVDTLILLVQDHELADNGLADFATTLAGEGITLIRRPVEDFGAPTDPEAYAETIEMARNELAAGRSLAVSCMAGFGRTGTFVACLLIDAGLDVDAAVQLTRASRPRTIERPVQMAFVHAWGASRPRSR